MTTLKLDEKTIARFWSKVDKNDPNGCWLWTASMHQGYGKFDLRIEGRRRNARAHRVAYALLVEDISSDRHLDHLCRVRHCVNPSHLRPVTNRENVLAGEGPTAINARKTHCPAGHAFDVANTRICPDGTRRCRACQLAWYHANKRYRGRDATALVADLHTLTTEEKNDA